MLPFKYALKHMRRSFLSCLAAIAASLIFSLLLCELNYALASQNTQLNEIFDSIEVKCVVSDVKGTKTDRLQINPTYVDACTNPVYEISEYIKDVCFKRRLRYNAIIPGEEPSIENIAEAPYLIGISMLEADSSLLPQNGVTVDFFNGYDETDLNTDKMICIVPASLVGDKAPSADMTLSLAVTYDYGPMFEKKPIVADLIVAGTYTGIVSEEDSIYCPWGAICSLAVEAGDIYMADSLSFTVKDNRKLNEFKSILWKYYSPVDVTAGDSIYSYAITVNDAVLNESVSSIDRNITLLNILIPLLLISSIGIGFVTSLILTRNRRPEFAVMRSMGARRGNVFFVAFIEQLMLGVLGALLGVIGYNIVRGFGASINLTQLGIYIGCYIIGAAAAVIRITTINVMQIMKVKE